MQNNLGFYALLNITQIVFTEKVLLKEIKALTLHRDQYTTGRRVSPIKQIECVNGDACHVYRPDVIQCINVDVNWRCEAELPNYIKFGSLSVICEGYDYPDDSYVLKGSCGLKYSFYYKDYSNYPDHKINSDDDKFIEEFFEYRNRSKLFSLLFKILWFALVIFILYNLISKCLTGNNNNNRQQRFGGGGNGHDNDDDNYFPRHGTFKNYQHQSSFQNNFRNNFQPGFWQGLGLGGLGEEPIRQQRQNYNYASSSSSSSSSSSMTPSVGFAGTKR
ncbi:13147_t:CDS:10 [Entrophospora sp. SA101]|nr:13147_t:CDS:10 [Entrophospora sp. SA101]